MHACVHSLCWWPYTSTVWSRTCISDTHKVRAYSPELELWAKTQRFPLSYFWSRYFITATEIKGGNLPLRLFPYHLICMFPKVLTMSKKTPLPILSWFPQPHVGSFASSSLQSTPPNVFTVLSSSQCPHMLACTWGISPSLKYPTIDLACLYCSWTIFSWSLQFPSLPAAVINSRISISPYWIERSVMQYPSSSKSIYTSEQNWKS